MSKNSAIEIFLRVRPTKKPFEGLTLRPEDKKIDIQVLKDPSRGYVNNQKENFTFMFDNLFGMEAKQQDIFDHVAKDVVDSALEGYNGTVFAYGQTGSGKTYTMTGGVERYVDRGMIPRTLSYIFSETKKRTDTFYKISLSYMEIYNDDGYDLLDENHTTKNLSDLPKVIPRELDDETLLLPELSVHKAESEEQALNLLFIGDTNRVVSETPKNDASTRSHCIFIIQIEGEKANSDGKKTIARLYLVDLSGSERVGKTEVEGLLLTEARYINLSLHYLEHVIICLNKRANGEKIHVPYRNSLMTKVLKDSLGGNSKTRMVATISAEKDDIDESISTCRFAQRVALIKNNLLKNEAVDPALIIKKLKKENEDLKNEIAFLKGDGGKTQLDQEDQENCRKIVEGFLVDPDPGARIVLKDMLMINECFYYFKHKFNDLAKRYDKQAITTSTKKVMSDGLEINDKGNNSTAQNEEIKRLKLLVQQRDNEILILLNLINKPKPPGMEDINIPIVNPQAHTSVIIGEPIESQRYKPMVFPKMEQQSASKEKSISEYGGTPQKGRGGDMTKPLDIVQRPLRNGNEDSGYKNASISMATTNQTAALAGISRAEFDNMLLAPLSLTNEQLKDRAACFELFRKSYRKNQALEENKEILKEKIDEAKKMGNLINTSRAQIERIKNQIEDLRKERALQGLLNNQNEVIKHPDEERLANEIEKHKKIYKDNFSKLKDLKAEIENIQNLLQKNHQSLQKDFDKWLEVVMNQNSIMTGTTQILTQAPLQNTLKESQRGNLNLSSTSGTSGVSNSSRSKSKLDPEVEKNLAAFYKARDELYKS